MDNLPRMSEEQESKFIKGEKHLKFVIIQMKDKKLEKKENQEVLILKKKLCFNCE